MTQAYDPKDCPMPMDFFLRSYCISRTTAWRWRKKGLPTLQVGAKIFCRESDFVRFMEAQTATHQNFLDSAILFAIRHNSIIRVFFPSMYQKMTVRILNRRRYFGDRADNAFNG